eukprot:gnl/TRDRNA2_/TRDRNA2_175282_c0_seq3.p1 gnl/TRDRNA2_/TRDRNA2_175282_c0~~gnl/TRDRNA2_/TRDRNA2_175282_c0_seq3.p1  ORF type:complete len:124 (-),score=2.02 gnl/TRDRNA2_/TRDRNA2_175282_c0_seq3:161-532(-)
MYNLKYLKLIPGKTKIHKKTADFSLIKIYIIDSIIASNCRNETIPDPCIPETEKDRSTIDFPQEWITPSPSQRPDIFPEFDRLKAPLPPPTPGDPETAPFKEEDHKRGTPHETEKSPIKKDLT